MSRELSDEEYLDYLRTKQSCHFQNYLLEKLNTDLRESITIVRSKTKRDRLDDLIVSMVSTISEYYSE